MPCCLPLSPPLSPQVRDRAAASLKLLTADDVGPAKLVVGGKLPMGPRAMTRSLREYQARPVPGSFTFDALPAVEEEAVATKVRHRGAPVRARGAVLTTVCAAVLLLPTSPHECRTPTSPSPVLALVAARRPPVWAVAAATWRSWPRCPSSPSWARCSGPRLRLR